MGTFFWPAMGLAESGFCYKERKENGYWEERVVFATENDRTLPWIPLSGGHQWDTLDLAEEGGLSWSDLGRQVREGGPAGWSGFDRVLSAGMMGGRMQRSHPVWEPREREAGDASD